MEERQQLEELLNAHSERLQALKVRAARSGISTPPEVLNEVDAIQRQIAELNQQRGVPSATTNQAANTGASQTDPQTQLDAILQKLDLLEQKIVLLTPPSSSQTPTKPAGQGEGHGSQPTPPEPGPFLRPIPILIALLIAVAGAVGLWQAWPLIQGRSAAPVRPPIAEVCPNRHETGERIEQFDIKVDENQVAYYGGWGFDGKTGGFFVTIEGPYRGTHTLYNGVFCGPVAASSPQAEAVRKQVESECKNCTTRLIVP